MVLERIVFVFRFWLLCINIFSVFISFVTFHNGEVVFISCKWYFIVFNSIFNGATGFVDMCAIMKFAVLADFKNFRKKMRQLFLSFNFHKPKRTNSRGINNFSTKFKLMHFCKCCSVLALLMCI